MTRALYVVAGLGVVAALFLIGFFAWQEADHRATERFVPLETTLTEHGRDLKQLLTHNKQIADLQMRVTTLEARPVYVAPTQPAVEGPRTVPVFPRNH